MPLPRDLELSSGDVAMAARNPTAESVQYLFQHSVSLSIPVSYLSDGFLSQGNRGYVDLGWVLS